MNETLQKSCTAFDGNRRLAAGALPDVARKVKYALEGGATGPVFIFDDSTGRVIDLDTRGTADDVVARLEADSMPRGPGRPKLGVVAREVTLLPRHWDWLNSQPGGASVALRKLVETARRANGDQDRRRAAQEAAHRFLSAMAGNAAGYEEALRALYADDRRRFADLAAAWPEDVRDHAIKLAFADLEPSASPAAGAVPGRG